MFQLGKILVMSAVATMGTSAIAANAVTGTIANWNNLPGFAINPDRIGSQRMRWRGKI